MMGGVSKEELGFGFMKSGVAMDPLTLSKIFRDISGTSEGVITYNKFMMACYSVP